MKYIILTALMLFSLPAFGLTFVNVLNDEPIRANDGTVEVVVRSVLPYTLYLDNEKIADVESPEEVLTFTLVDVDRGTHTLRIESFDKAEEITIHVLRAHK